MNPVDSFDPEDPERIEPNLEDWQVYGITLIVDMFFQKVQEECQKRDLPPPIAFLVTLDRHCGFISLNEEIRVRVKFRSGDEEEVGLVELWERYGEVEEIEPVQPSGAYLVHVQDRLLAWDVRSVLPLSLDSDEVVNELGLFSRGLAGARNRRRTSFNKLDPIIQKEVLLDTVNNALFFESKDKGVPQRVPQKGIIVAGGKRSLDTGDEVDKYVILNELDRELRKKKEKEILATDLSRGKSDDDLLNRRADPSPEPEDEEGPDQISHRRTPGQASPRRCSLLQGQTSRRQLQAILRRKRPFLPSHPQSCSARHQMAPRKFS